jgi:putative PIN family toxin of toxin-antitoxin system
MTLRVVLDTNVLVAALRSRRGASFRLIELLRTGAFEIAISVPLAVEYEAVLTRHAASLGIRRSEVTTIVDYLCAVGKRQPIYFLWRPLLRDPDDEFVLEVAVAAGCQYIVTHNVRHFVGADRLGVSIVRPGKFLRQVEESL